MKLVFDDGNRKTIPDSIKLIGGRSGQELPPLAASCGECARYRGSRLQRVAYTNAGGSRNHKDVDSGILTATLPIVSKNRYR